MATNVLVNPSFEAGSPFTGYSVPANTTLTTGTSGGADNGTTYGIETIAVTAARLLKTNAALTGLTTGDTVSVGLALKDASDSRQYAVGISWQDSGGTVVLNDYPTRTSVTSSWARRTYTSTCPSGAVKAALVLSSGNGTAGSTVKFDSAVLIKEAYSGGFIDFGESPEPPDVADGWSWVVICADDAAFDDMETIPQMAELAAEGVTFTNYYLSDPSCSPSRASFMTGKHAQNHGVPNINDATAAWVAGNMDAISIATKWTDAGGDAHLFGKFLHESAAQGSSWYPHGWDTGAISDVVYRQYEVELRKWTGSTVTFDVTGTDEDDYFTDDIAARAVAKINSTDEEVPLLLSLQPGNDHGNHGEDPIQPGPKVSPLPVYRERPTGGEIAKWTALGWDPDAPPVNGFCGTVSCTTIDPWFKNVPHNNVLMQNAVGWHPDHTRGSVSLANTKQQNRERAQSCQSLGDLIDTVKAALVSSGRDAFTAIMLTSDNGWHDGQWALPPSKGALYPTDTHVPLIIRPPGGGDPRTITDLVTTADLYATILESAGITVPGHCDGLSLVPALEGDAGRAKRKRHGMRFRTDKTWDQLVLGGQPASADGITGYTAAGTEVLFVSYQPDASTAPPVGKGEFFIITDDPYLLVNRYPELSPDSRTAYMAALVATRAASGSTARTIALDVLPDYVLGEDTEPEVPGRVVKINGFDLSEIGVVESVYSPKAGMRGADLDATGRDGTRYVGGKRATSGYVEIVVSILADQTLSRGLRWTSVRDRKDLLLRKCDPQLNASEDGSDFLTPILLRAEDLQEREARVQFLEPIDYSAFDPELARVRIRADIPGTFWRHPERLTETQNLGWTGSQQEGLTRFDMTSDAPVQDALITIRAGAQVLKKPTVKDGQSFQTGFKYKDNLDPGMRLEVNCETSVARVFVDEADHTGTKVKVDGLGLPGCYLRFVPSRENGRITAYVWADSTAASDASISVLLAPRYHTGI